MWQHQPVGNGLVGLRTTKFPAINPVGTQNRYAACVRFNAKNSDGRYTGSRDALAVFVAGRLDQFVDPSMQLGTASQANP